MTKWKFIGEDGSMGLKTGETYEVMFIPTRSFPAVIEVPAQEVRCPYSSWELFFRNWEYEKASQTDFMDLPEECRKRIKLQISQETKEFTISNYDRVVTQCQEILADYITPGSKLSGTSALNMLIGILDDRDFIKWQKNIKEKYGISNV